MMLAAAVLTLTYWVAPAPDPADAELAVWALERWQTESDGRLKLTPAPDRSAARIRVLWADARSGSYGEMRPILVNGQPGAEVFVRPDIAASARHDPLLRDAIVYLTCLHETGHALGLAHTAAFADIMYSFEFGGDIARYFSRFRERLSSRLDLRTTSAVSPADKRQLMRRLDR